MLSPLAKMAASLAPGNLLRSLTSIRSIQALTSGHWRLYATTSQKVDLDSSRQPRVAVAPDNSCIICWHPEVPFPYECTQPLPRHQEEAAEVNSPLKVNLLMEEQLKMRPEGPTDQELSNIFHTTKHAWRPRTQLKYRKPPQSPDREGL